MTADSPTLGKNRSFYNREGSLAYRHDGRRQMSFAHVYLAGSLVATREQSSATGVATVKYHHTDALGTPVATTDANRNVVERSEYEPYGKLLNRPANDGPGYTGHVEDAQTGLVYMQQRYFDPLCGCFLSVDSIAAHSVPGFNFNRYWYAYNNPYKFMDPDGRLGHIAAGAGIGAVFGGGMELFRQLSTSGTVSDWGAVATETGKGAAVGAATAAVPVGIASGALNFGSRLANAAAVGGNAAAAGASGEIAAQIVRGEQIDAGQAIVGGAANLAGVGVGHAIAPMARAMSTVSTEATPGVAVPSLTGRIFIVGAVPATTSTSPVLAQGIQDATGAGASAIVQQVTDNLREQQ